MQVLLLAVLMTFVAAASGFVGSFALQRRMSLVADAFSHVALPGLGFAFLINANPLFGGILALILGALVIWVIQEKSKLPTENIVGIIFIFSLAIGALLTPESDLIEALFGGVSTITLVDLSGSIVIALGIIVTMHLIKDRLLILGLSIEISKSLKIRAPLYNALFLILFALTVILGLKFLGVLLMGALIIIPSAIAKLFSWNQNSDILLSQSFAILSVNVGLVANVLFNSPLGPTIAIVCFILFIGGFMGKTIFGK